MTISEALHRFMAVFSSAYHSGWRPTAGWICGLILLVNGVIMPASRLWGYNFEPLDWRALTVFVSAILGLGFMRTLEKRTDDPNG